jgi:DNA-binding GntR family transcriptional regulator
VLWQHVDDAETVLESDPDRFIRTHTDFHGLIVDLAGNETLRILDRMLHAHRRPGQLAAAGRRLRVARRQAATHQGAALTASSSN